MVVLEAHISLERLILRLAQRRLIKINDDLLVDGHFDAGAGALDLDRVPLWGGLDRVGFGRHISIQRSAALLSRLRPGIIEKLDLIGIVGGATSLISLGIIRRRSNADAAVALGRHAVFHVQNKIRVFLLVSQEPISVAGAVHEAVLHRPDRLTFARFVLVFLGSLRDPAVQVFAVEKRYALLFVTPGATGKTNR